MATRSLTTLNDETLYGEIIVGVDAESGGRDAACLARVLGPASRRTLVYVQLFNPAGDHPMLLAVDQADDGGALGGALAEERRLCAGSPACVRVLSDSVAAGLDDEARRRMADLIVVGSCHRHGLARLLWGDDTRAVLHRSPLALAVAPRGYAQAPRTPQLVGAVDDPRADAEGTVARARLLADRFGAELLVRQIDPAPTGSLRTQLREFAAEVDLLVCASHREASLGRLVMASPSDWLVRHVHIPLLITSGTA